MKKINKKVFILVVFLLIIIGVIFIILFNNKKITAEEKLSNLLKQMSSEFYEEFYYNQRCKHIAACLNHYGNMVLSNDRNSIIKDISKNIFSSLKKENSYGYLPKEELQLVVEVDLNGKVTLKLGLNKLYVLKNKMLEDRDREIC